MTEHLGHPDNPVPFDDLEDMLAAVGIDLLEKLVDSANSIDSIRHLQKNPNSTYFVQGQFCVQGRKKPLCIYMAVGFGDIQASIGGDVE